MQPFVIPTIFTAVNQFSTPVQGMTTSLNGLGISAARAERALNVLTAPLRGITGNMMMFAGQAAIAAAIIGGLAFTGKGVADYATEVSNLSAVTGATGHNLEIFKSEIADVADVTKKSMVYVAQAFTTVDNNMPELHTDAAALAEVTKQAIILAKASRIELAQAAEYLTMSMNQFGHSAAQAGRDVDAMAAGAVFGSSRIGETAEALQVFGATAKNVANMTFAESVALVELGSKFEKGSEAGTRFNRILVDMTAIKPNSELSRHLQMYGVNVQTVSNRALPFFDRLKEISKIKGSPVLMEETFGKRGIAMAAGLFSRVDEFQNILAHTSESGRAELMAATNVNNISGALEQLRDKWMNVFITSTETNGAMNILKGTIVLLTNHLDGIVTVAILAADAFLLWKGYIIGARLAIPALNFVMGVATVINGEYATSCFASIAGMNGMAFASYFLEASLLELTLVTGGVLIALGLIYFAFTDNYTAGSRMNDSLDKTKDGFKQVVPTITQAQIALDKYNDAMDLYNQVQDLRAHREYAYSQSWARGIAFDVTHAVTNPILSEASHRQDMGAYGAPNKADYPALANNPRTDQAQQQAYAMANGGSMTKQQIELMIHNNSGHDISTDVTGAPAVNVSSTTNSWNGK